MGMRLLVDSLPRSFTVEKLCALFASYGQVLSAQVIKIPDQPVTLIGTVEMATEQDADRAMTALHGTIIENEMILVFKEPQQPD